MKSACIFLLLPFLLSLSVWAIPPVPFMGKVSVRGVNYFGGVQFTFSLHNGKSTTIWTNGEKVGETIKVPVHNGRYHVLLGGQGMSSLPPALFLNNDELYLRVEFDNGDGKGLRHLGPDQLMTATTRALVTEVAKVAKVSEKVAECAITVPMLSPALLADLNRSGGITQITRDMLPQDVSDDLNRTVRLLVYRRLNG
jgi:hypothetical protein